MRKVLNNYNALVSKRIICVIFSMIIFRGIGNTKIDTYSNTLNGSALVNGATFEVKDDHWISVNPFGADTSILSTTSVKNFILFEISDHDNLYKNAAINQTIVIKVERWSLTGVYSTVNETLDISFNPAAGTIYNARKFVSYTGSHKIKITVLTQPASNLFLKLSANIIVDRIYKFKTFNRHNPQATLPKHIGASFGNNEIKFNWIDLYGADEYDLEYTYFAENSNQLNFTSNYVHFNWLFNTNASRITTNVNSATIQITYPKGYIFYRVRGVHYDQNGVRETTKWSSDTISPNISLNTFASKITLGTSSLEPNFNWQVSRSFAEEGKNLASINYFDGSLRTRQSVNELKYEAKAMVGSTLYDWIGRPVIDLLPYPDTGSTLKYKSGILKKANGTNIALNDYDGVNCLAGVNTIQLSSSVGTGEYYSPNNRFMPDSVYRKFLKYIPKSNGYGYSQTVYMPDGTDRKFMSAGPGDALRISQGKETKYFYGKPSQNELDRLFGNDVGFNRLYQKNMVFDPNGQASVSYLNSEGKTIATALAGYTPSSLDSIPNNSVEFTIVDSLNDDSIKDDTLQSTHTILLSIPSNLVLTYNINPAAYQNSCITSTCYDCLYNIDIIIKDKCGSTAYTFSHKNYTLGSGFNTDCSPVSPNALINQSTTFTNLPAGEYIITKSLSIPNDSINAYADRFITNISNTCIPNSTTLTSVFTAALQNNCNVDCATCVTQLGSLSTFLSTYITRIQALGITPTASDTMISNNMHAEALLDCKNKCEEENDCTRFKSLLEADMSPGGQYGLYNYDQSLLVYTISDLTSIFYGSSPIYKTVNYTNELNQPDSIEVEDSKIAINQLSIADFIENWKETWAKNLIVKHPEYCYLRYCDSLRNYLKFDSLLRTTDSYAVANANGWLDPINLDPFFGAGGSGAPYKTHIIDTFNNVVPGFCTSITLRNLIQVSIYCDGLWPCADTLPCPQDQNMFWIAFRNAYFGMKRKYICRLIDSYAAGGCANSSTYVMPKCIGANPPGCPNSNYATKAKRWICPAETNAGLGTYIDNKKDSVLLQIRDSLNSTCDSYIDSWMYKLSSCPCISDPVKKDSIKARFLRLCKKGSDLAHPLGSTTIPGNVGDTSFAQILQSVCGINYTICEQNCNASFIQIPGTYTKPAYLAVKQVQYIRKDTCLCTNVTKLRTCYTNKAGADTTTSFLSFLKQMGDYHLSKTDLDTLEARCSTKCYYLPNPIDIPPYFDCDVCKPGLEVRYQDSVYFANCIGVNASRKTYEAHMNAKLGLNLDSIDYKNFLSKWDPNYRNIVSCSEVFKLCPRTILKFPGADTSCLGIAMDLVNREVQLAIQAKKDSLRSVFIAAYKAHCFAQPNKCWSERKHKEYHYTLYYYDQAGNLVKTVPPEGVIPNDNALYLANVKAYRTLGTGSPQYPAHIKATKYIYNTLGNIVRQLTPDGGVTKFWYDVAGRIVLSQQAWQDSTNKRRYSYTRYDALSRIIESGELNYSSNPAWFNDTIILRPDTFTLFYTGSSSRKFVSRTFYDFVQYSAASSQFGASGQENLRNRISSVSYFLTYTGNDNSFHNATHYSYDLSGNVKAVIQDIPGMLGSDQRYKILRYEYDLISQKVNCVRYQPGQADQYIHKYYYDDDNRLTRVETSLDDFIWEVDARYQYLPHGPLGRKEIGDVRVQGVDYAYTLQGWLKAINGGALDSIKEMGCDAYNLNTYNKFVGVDAYGVTLSYFQNDYLPIKGAYSPELSYNANFNNNAANLYNGNIRSSTYCIRGFNSDSMRGYAYRYDQLNRLKRSSTWTGYDKSAWTWTGASPVGAYRTEYRYSPDGNIDSLKRWDNAGVLMDNMLYTYKPNPLTTPYPSQNNNQLSHVSDNGTPNSGANDILNQSANNYLYDASGQLTRDNAEGINSITWTPQGKVDKIVKSNNLNIQYYYDAMQNRIAKYIYWAPPGSFPTIDTTYYYIRDAQGNVMAYYRKVATAFTPGTFKTDWQEQYIYGSERVGYIATNVNLYNSNGIDALKKGDQGSQGFNPADSLTNDSDNNNHDTNLALLLPPQPTTGFVPIGRKRYEFTDHLGNVLVALTDRKIGVGTTNNTPVSYWKPDILSATDYYPFGMAMPGRKSMSDKYRYGYNNQEKDEEVAGNGNTNTAEFWEYNTRLGRRWNLDPVVEAGQSGYACFNNNPIAYNDIKGDNPDGDPVKSEYLGSFSTSSSFVNGIADGFIGALPEAGEFVWNMITDGDARADFMEGMSAIMQDPLGAVQAFAGAKYDLYAAVLSGSGTEQQQYEVGKDIGNIIFGLATGAAASKLTEVIKVAKYEKQLVKAAEAADKTTGPGKATTRGTAVHKKFEKAVGKDKAEVSYKGGKEAARRGQKGSVRADAIYGSKTKPKIAYDLKTGKSGVSKSDATKYKQNLPKGTKLKEISKDANGKYSVKKVK
ncbi:MAG: hypothetical protein HOP11_07940 [Saprospiraceae bacterium]|nr:hypothetical protein [Saprospiraceae bacterium]